MVIAKVYIYQKRFDGFPTKDCLKLVEEELSPLKNGEFLAEAVYLSVDPYMRPVGARFPLGDTFTGSQVAKITESKNPKFPVGQYVEGQFGWRTHTIISDGKYASIFPTDPVLLRDFGNLPLSYAVGILGMPGNSAYFGFLEVCQPKKGETVIITGAGGAVGSIVGQIAKIKGCTVIGVTGSDEKGKWLVEELGFDHFINYKITDLNKAIPELAPQGIDCYFDNVGGEISSTILNHMNKYGRISVCGNISSYNEKGNPKASIVQGSVLGKSLRMEGFAVYDRTDRWAEGIKQLTQWVKEGKLKHKETVTNGFENMFEAFTDMLKGGNIGKAIVKV